MSGSLDPESRAELLRIARRTIERELVGALAESWGSEASIPEPLRARRGAFVTLTAPAPESDGKISLRGCIGDLEPADSLAETTARCARQAAFSDPRFSPLTSAEWPAVRLSISVLTEPREIASADEIEVGRHGVVLEKGVKRSVFLPQVAIEQGWDRETLLDRLSRKAGLPGDAWKGGRLFVFEAESFGELRDPVETRGPDVH